PPEISMRAPMTTPPEGSFTVPEMVSARNGVARIRQSIAKTDADRICNRLGPRKAANVDAEQLCRRRRKSGVPSAHWLVTRPNDSPIIDIRSASKLAGILPFSVPPAQVLHSPLQIGKSWWW